MSETTNRAALIASLKAKATSLRRESGDDPTDTEALLLAAAAALATHDAETRTAALEEAAVIARVAARINSTLLGRPHPVAVSIAAAIRATAGEETQ